MRSWGQRSTGGPGDPGARQAMATFTSDGAGVAWDRWPGWPVPRNVGVHPPWPAGESPLGYPRRAVGHPRAERIDGGSFYLVGQRLLGMGYAHPDFRPKKPIGRVGQGGKLFHEVGDQLPRYHHQGVDGG